MESVLKLSDETPGLCWAGGGEGGDGLDDWVPGGGGLLHLPGRAGVETEVTPVVRRLLPHRSDGKAPALSTGLALQGTGEGSQVSPSGVLLLALNIVHEEEMRQL